MLWASFLIWFSCFHTLTFLTVYNWPISDVLCWTRLYQTRLHKIILYIGQFLHSTLTMRMYSKNYAYIEQKQQRLLKLHRTSSGAKVPPQVGFLSQQKVSTPTQPRSGSAQQCMGSSIHPLSLLWLHRVERAVNTPLQKMILAPPQHLLKQPIRGSCCASASCLHTFLAHCVCDVCPFWAFLCSTAVTTNVKQQNLPFAWSSKS